jgi:hypothetical protein
MEDWGEELQTSFKIDTLVCTYESHIRVKGENDTEPFDLCFGESCLYYNGVYYGDWSVNAEPFFESNIQTLDEKKAIIPVKKSLITYN